MQAIQEATQKSLTSAIMNDEGLSKANNVFPGIQKGDLITFDYKSTPQVEDIVIVKKTGDPDYIVRRFYMDKDNFIYLTPENADFPDLKISRKKVQLRYPVVSVTSTYFFKKAH